MPTPTGFFLDVAARYGGVDPGDLDAVQRWFIESMPELPPETINQIFDEQLSNYRTSIDVEGQKAAVSEIQKILWNDVPAAYPYFYNYLSGHDSSVQGMEATALGHVILSGA